MTVKKWLSIPLGPFQAELVHLVPPKQPPPIEECAEVGDYLETNENNTPWHRGDFYNYIREAYGEEHSQLLSDRPGAEDTYRDYGYVCERFPPARRKYAELGLSMGHHKAVAQLPPATADRLLKKAYENNWPLSTLRQEVRLLKRRTVVEGTADMPEGTFRVIYADPPWMFDDQGRMPDGSRSTTLDHYPGMEMDDIRALDVRSHAQPNSVLFLWVPVPMLMENSGPRDVIEDWGFNYKSKIVWSKGRHNRGHYVSNRHEDLLICTRGSCTPDRLTPMIDNVQVIRAEGEHSEKPEEFRKIIERLYDGPYLEMFARREVEGWTCWGNQLGVKAA